MTRAKKRELWPGGALARAVLAAWLQLLATPGRAEAQQGPLALPDLPRRTYFGASLADVPDSLLRRGAPHGVYVVALLPGGPAAAAGLRPGDILVHVGTDSIASVPDAVARLRSAKAGTPVPLRVYRHDHLASLRYLPREWPREAAADFSIVYSAVATPDGRRRVVLTSPRDAGRHPTVLLLGGIGCFSIDAPGTNDPYRDLLYHLTRQGYATARVEKSGVGDSDGPPCATADFDAELAGYAAALTALPRFPFVDSTRVFLLGHSIGGIGAPALIARHLSSTPVRGVVVLSTVGINWYEYELANLRRQLVLGGLSADSVEREMSWKIRCGYRLLVAGETGTTITADEPRCKRFLQYPAPDRYLQQVAAINVGEIWSAVARPVLVLGAESDFVTSEEELEGLADAINRAHPGTATYAEVRELDHHLSHEASKRAAFSDATPPALRPYYGATFEPLLDRWLDSLSRATASPPA